MAAARSDNMIQSADERRNVQGLDQIRNYTNGPAAAGSTAMPGPTEQFKKVDLKQENPVATPENSSSGREAMMYDIGKLSFPPLNGTIHGH